VRKLILLSFLIPKFVLGEMQYFQGGLTVPEFWEGSSGGLSINGTTIDADDEKLAFVLQAPKSGNIRKIAFKTQGVTTGGNLATRLESVTSATGLPSGSLFCADSSTYTVIASTDDFIWKTGAPFLADCAVTKGDFLAPVIQREAGSTFNGGLGRNGENVTNFSYSLSSNSSSGWVKAGNAAWCQLEYDDGTYAYSPGVYPYNIGTSWSITNSSNPNTIAIRVMFRQRVSVTGAWVFVGGVDQTATYTITVYDSNGAPMLPANPRTKAIDATGTSAETAFTFFGTSYIFEANTWYRVGITPTSSTITLVDVSAASAAVMESFPYGSLMHMSTGTTPSSEASWSNNTLRRPMMGLILDGIDPGPKNAIYDSTIYNGTFQ
jgi:hypothetical protein